MADISFEPTLLALSTPPSSSTMTQQDPKHARVRDNQRRSRARKREYIQEIEEKVRLCESQGVEASSELQRAARKVAEENRRLRELLRCKGVAEEEIEGFVRSEDVGVCMVEVVGGAERLLQLEKALEVRECCARKSLTSKACAGSGCSPTIASEPCKISSANSPCDEQRDQNSVVESQMPEAHMSPNRASEALSVYATGLDTPLSSQVNCAFAADMITTMAGGDPTVVKAQLGCMTEADCEVKHEVMFNLMDRYTSAR